MMTDTGYGNEIRTSISARPVGRSLSDFEPLMPLEKLLQSACKKGKFAQKTPRTKPQAPTQYNTIRANFLRFLALGGDELSPVHESGVKLIGAWIKGELDLSNATTASSIDCRFCVFDSPLKLRYAKIRGNLNLQRSSVRSIIADGLQVTGDILLRDGFQTTGSVRLTGAKIGGNLECDGSRFRRRNSFVISLDGAKIDGDVFLRKGLKSLGGIRMIGAKIGGDLDCTGGIFINRTGRAICCNRAIIDGEVFLCGEENEKEQKKYKFRAKGSIEFINTNIRGQLTCENADLHGNGELAIAIDSAKIGKNVFLRNDLRVFGTVRMQGARIGGGLNLKIGQIKTDQNILIVASGMNVAGTLILQKAKDSITKYKIILQAAKVRELNDESDAWGGDLELDGFTYQSIIGNGSTSAEERKNWLKLQKGLAAKSLIGVDFHPQPWRQLQKVLREMGHIEDSRQIAIAFEDQLREKNLIGQLQPTWPGWSRCLYRCLIRFFHYAFRILTGYGYRPTRLLAWFAGVWLACGTFYWAAALPPHNVFAPSNPMVFQNQKYAVCEPDSDTAKAEQSKLEAARTQGAGNWYLCKTLPQEYTGFSPLAYSLDIILPLVDLQQQNDWAPMIPTPKPSPWNEWRGSGWKHITRMVLWAETLFGWLASLLLVAIVSGLTKRRED